MTVGPLGKMLLLVRDRGAVRPSVHGSRVSTMGFTEVGEPGTPCWFEMYSRAYDAAVGRPTSTSSMDAHGR